ncbi:MAG: NRDE family protein [Betaproteobacteria bacterium]|nr:NRDE family protein [Betaproteobacteria bacterium]
MCLAIVAFRAHSRFPLIVAANRDEFHARATAAAHWWSEGVLAGKDLAAGGSWFGCTRSGRYALLTNYRDGVARRPGPRSRGLLVTDVLLAPTSPEKTVLQLLGQAGQYEGFNLLAGDRDELVYLSNREGGCRALPAGVYGLSNHLLDTPWPKLRRTKNRFIAWLEAGAADDDALFHLLRDPSRPQDHLLPRTGLPLEWERLLGAAFIVSPSYGTRSCTLLRIDAAGNAQFIERSFDPAGQQTGEQSHSFWTT